MAKKEGLKQQVLEALTQDSRTSCRSMAESFSASTTTVSKVVKGLEEEGIIIGYNCQVDWHKLGYDSMMCLQIATAKGADLEKIGKALKRLPAIKQVFYIMGDTTYAAYAVCKDHQEAAQVLEDIRKISGVEKVVSHVVLKVF